MFWFVFFYVLCQITTHRTDDKTRYILRQGFLFSIQCVVEKKKCNEKKKYYSLNNLVSWVEANQRPCQTQTWTKTEINLSPELYPTKQSSNDKRRTASHCDTPTHGGGELGLRLNQSHIFQSNKNILVSKTKAHSLSAARQFKTNKLGTWRLQYQLNIKSLKKDSEVSIIRYVLLEHV